MCIRDSCGADGPRSGGRAGQRFPRGTDGAAEDTGGLACAGVRIAERRRAAGPGAAWRRHRRLPLHVLAAARPCVRTSVRAAPAQGHAAASGTTSAGAARRVRRLPGALRRGRERRGPLRRRGTQEQRQLLKARETICCRAGAAAAATVIENYIYLAYGQGESAPRQFTSLVASAGLRRRMQQQTVSSGWRPSLSTGLFSSSTARTLFNPVTHSWAFAAVSARIR